MLNFIFPLFYAAVALALLWQAVRVITEGVKPIDAASNTLEDRTGRITIHPELLDKEGRLTEEELLTVRFSEDNDSTEASAE